jgi:hypothetical protein
MQVMSLKFEFSDNNSEALLILRKTSILLGFWPKSSLRCDPKTAQIIYSNGNTILQLLVSLDWFEIFIGVDQELIT